MRPTRASGNTSNNDERRLLCRCVRQDSLAAEEATSPLIASLIRIDSIRLILSVLTLPVTLDPCSVLSNAAGSERPRQHAVGTGGSRCDREPPSGRLQLNPLEFDESSLGRFDPRQVRPVAGVVGNILPNCRPSGLNDPRDLIDQLLLQFGMLPDDVSSL